MGPRVDRREVQGGSREGLGGAFVSSGGRIWVYIKLNRFMYTENGPQRGSHRAPKGPQCTPIGVHIAKNQPLCSETVPQ